MTPMITLTVQVEVEVNEVRVSPDGDIAIHDPSRPYGIARPWLVCPRGGGYQYVTDRYVARWQNVRLVPEGNTP